MRRRVAVTGIGLVAPHGGAPLAVFDALHAGQSAVGLWNEEGAAPAAVARAPFDPAPWFTRLQLAGVDRVSQIAVAAADLARRDAGLDSAARRHRRLRRHRHGRRARRVEAAYRGHYAASACRRCRCRPSCRTRRPPTWRCAFGAARPGADLFGGLRLVGGGDRRRRQGVACGDVDMALAGGSEALLVPGAIRAWQALQTLARVDDDPARACRPFAADRSGLVLGEGAAFLCSKPTTRQLPAAPASMPNLPAAACPATPPT